jgi:hypothetical protein
MCKNTLKPNKNNTIIIHRIKKQKEYMQGEKMDYTSHVNRMHPCKTKETKSRSKHPYWFCGI